MPYTKQEDRKPMKIYLEAVANLIKSQGDLTYAITYLMHLRTMQVCGGKDNYEVRYGKMSQVRASAQDASDEYYRVVMGRYEDQKRRENGPVSSLDTPGMEDVR